MFKVFSAVMASVVSVFDLLVDTKLDNHRSASVMACLSFPHVSVSPTLPLVL